jgi:hypothetical protein
MEAKIITTRDVDKVKGNANFGSENVYNIIKLAVLKVASGYASGSTVKYMMQELGLVTKDRKRLTKKGKQHLWEWYHRKHGN